MIRMMVKDAEVQANFRKKRKENLYIWTVYKILDIDKSEKANRTIYVGPLPSPKEPENSSTEIKF